MQSLASAPFRPDVEAALTTTLEACRNLTGGAYLSIYQARGDSPVYFQLAQLGEQNTFPDQLSPSDVPTLNSSSVWVSGKRPTCYLHRIARSGNFSYLASMPIGDANAVIGLLIIAGNYLPNLEYLDTILRAIGTYAHSLLQGYSLLSQQRQDIQLQQKYLSVTSAVQGAVEEGVIVLTAELTISSMNNAAENCLGYSNSEVTNQSIYNILIGSEELTPAFISTQRGRNYSTQDTVRLFRRNGNPFPASLRLLPIMADDALQNILVIFQDVSEQEEFRVRNQQLEQRALLGEVTASFAHEVRNPINNISTGLQLLAYNLPPDDSNQDNIHRLQNDCERLAELVKSSLSFVRPMEYQLEPLDLASFLGHTIERWKPRLERYNIKPHLQIEEDLPPVEGDIRALEQVWTNLITNAMQAMDGKEGVLAIKARRVLEPAIPKQIEVSISDTGPGIPPEIRDRIFEPFFTTKQSGTGLGLAIVKRIVTAHKGAIHLDSMPGGTIFSVILPAARDSETINGDS
jgi:PAS domain S-box-containing protein